jgi:pyrroloquinoline quinone biosynthesis protein E
MSGVSRTSRPRLADKGRLRWDRHDEQHLLVYPERGLELNESAAAIFALCDGRTLADIASVLAERTGAPLATIEADLLAFVADMHARGLLVLDGVRVEHESDTRAAQLAPTETPRPYTLICELTYRCPLKCPYCSNPIELAAYRHELDTQTWSRVFEEAEALGVVQLHLTGGEPLARADLEALVAKARSLSLYTNLITSAVPLSRERLLALKDAGLDNVQVSFQDAEAASADEIAGYAGMARKLEAAGWVKEVGLPLTVNVVLHRANLDRVEAIVALAERLRADRLELANTQYLGWALENRDALLPTAAQLAHAADVARAAKARLAGQMEVLFVKPDYFGARPKACMDGWARRFVHVTPTGDVLPCHAAMSIPGLRFDNVRERSLSSIWSESEAMRAFRGEGWMKEPCRSCAERTIDFGGCRCQAFALTGDAAATDPACALSPVHALIDRAKRAAQGAPIRFRYRAASKSD